MKSHALLYKAVMSRADRAGIKRNTRRVATENNSLVDGMSARSKAGKALWAQLDWSKAYTAAGPAFIVPDKSGKRHRVTPIYGVGDEVWFRETWQVYHHTTWEGRPDGAIVPEKIPRNITDTEHYGFYKWSVAYKADFPGTEDKFRPSIHMPKWACRISHILNRVGAEFVQDISEEDAAIEGVERNYATKWPGTNDGGTMQDMYRRNFARLWNSINAAPRPKAIVDGKPTLYVSAPWDEASRDQRETINGLPHHCRPNPAVWVLGWPAKEQPGDGEEAA